MDVLKHFIYFKELLKNEGNMGAQCNSCGCNDQGEFKMNEVQLDDNNKRKNKVYGGAYT